jgi:Mg-chelatase subunit ChlD
MGFRGAYSPTMAQEICNAYSHIMYGGDVVEAFDGPGYGKPGYEKNLKDFLSKLDYSYEGRTPMAKALSIIATIYNQKTESTSNRDDGDEDDAIDLFSERDGSCGSKLAQCVNDDLDKYEKLMPSGSYTSKTFGTDGKDTLKSVAVAKIDIHQLNVLNKLARLKIYENEIAAHKEITWKVNPLSTDVKIVPLTDFSQSLKVSPVQRAMPHYQYKLATKQVMPKEHIKYTIKKQCLAFLIDDSGSMCDPFKMEWVKALLLNRIDQVVRGEAELYICTFEDELDSNAWIPVRNKEEADKVLENFNGYFEFDRGATDIEKAVTQAIIDIKSGTLNGNITIDSIKPQICVINDGDDYISPHYTPDFVVHGFILGSTNHNMKKMCEKSGGIYEQFNR